jgi:hypothetical protein
MSKKVRLESFDEATIKTGVKGLKEIFVNACLLGFSKVTTSLAYPSLKLSNSQTLFYQKWVPDRS